MKICTTCSRTYIDDTLKFCSGDGKFLSVSYEPDVDARIRIHPARKMFDTGSLTAVNIEESVVAINISEQFSYIKTADELYNYTRGFWWLKRETAEKADYAFAVYKGAIKEVYKIGFWELAKVQVGHFKSNKSNFQTFDGSASPSFGRYQFYGVLASESIRNKYIGKYIPITHGQSPILYFNC